MFVYIQKYTSTQHQVYVQYENCSVLSEKGQTDAVKLPHFANFNLQFRTIHLIGKNLLPSTENRQTAQMERLARHFLLRCICEFNPTTLRSTIFHPESKSSYIYNIRVVVTLCEFCRSYKTIQKRSFFVFAEDTHIFYIFYH